MPAVFDHAFNYFIIIVEAFIYYLLLKNVLSCRFNQKYSIFLIIGYLFIPCIRYYFNYQGIITSNTADSFFQTFNILGMFFVTFIFFKDPLFLKFLWTSIVVLILATAELVTMTGTLLLFHITPTEILTNPTVLYTATLLSKLIAFFCTQIIIHMKKHTVIIPKHFLIETVFLIFSNLIFLVFAAQLLNDVNYIKTNPELYLIITIAFILFMCIFTMSIIYKLSKKAQEELEKQLILHQIEMENKLNKDMTSVVESLRALRHDMNNHIGIIKGLTTAGQYNELNTYVNQLCTDLETANDFIFVKDKSLSILLNSKIMKAKEKEISFDVLLSADEIKITDKDMCALLGNIIDNAIEAAEKVEKNKYIELVIKETSHGCSIHCENTFSQAPVQRKNVFITSKKEADLHGIGTTTIRKIVCKYNGTIHFSYDDLFIIDIFLPYINEQNKENGL